MATDNFSVKQGVDPKYLKNTLTKDISPLEALFDLMDNSVDAARERRMADGKQQIDRYGLPADYSGCRIRVRIGHESIVLADNCTGIDEDSLARTVFVTGTVSEHRFGIGGFGIGLKRALIRLGGRYVLATDTGEAACLMTFGQEQLTRIESTLTAKRVASKGRAKTTIVIGDLQPGVWHELCSMPRRDLAKHVARRYGLFLAKGFCISIDGMRVPEFGPRLRASGPLAALTKNIRTAQGVDIFIDAGMHEDYRLTHEPEYVNAKNKALTDQYGWYFVCNDRIVRVASHERELGWSANWHQEYYGFVGWIRFVAEHPEQLPWDTKKTQIDPHSSAFREVAERLQEFAELYKTGNKKAREDKLSYPREGATAATGNGKSSRPATPNPSTAGQPDATHRTPGGMRQKKPGDKALSDAAINHNEHWENLLPPLGVTSRHPKLGAMVFEAERLPVKTPYAAAMLFRAIVEFALFQHLKATATYVTVREAYFQEQAEADRPLTIMQKKSFRPTFKIALEWLNRNDDYFPINIRRDCATSRNKFGMHLKELNGVVHEGDLIDSGKLKIIRNDTLPLLRFLLAG